MTRLRRVAQLWASLAALVLQLNVPPAVGSPQQRFLLRNLEPIFREDLIPPKNGPRRTPPDGGRFSYDGAERDFSDYSLQGEFGGRITPHSHLVLFLGGRAASRNHRPKSPPPVTQFNGNDHAVETQPLFHYGNPFGPLPLLDSTYLLHSHPFNF